MKNTEGGKILRLKGISRYRNNMFLINTNNEIIMFYFEL